MKIKYVILNINHSVYLKINFSCIVYNTIPAVVSWFRLKLPEIFDFCLYDKLQAY